MRLGMRILLVVLAALAAGPGCRSSRRHANPLEVLGTKESAPRGAAKKPGTSKPTPPTPANGNGASVAVARPGYVLAVSVQVDGKKEIDEAGARVSEEGDVRLPLVGAVPVAGLSLSELRDKITELYRGFFIQPQVDVDFVADGKSGVTPWGFVTVLGRVKNPGQVPLPPTGDMPVVAAIQAAGGFDTSADQGGVRVTRSGPKGPETRRVNLKTVGAQGYAGTDLSVRHGDVIFVPEWIF